MCCAVSFFSAVFSIVLYYMNINHTVSNPVDSVPLFLKRKERAFFIVMSVVKPGLDQWTSEF